MLISIEHAKTLCCYHGHDQANRGPDAVLFYRLQEHLGGTDGGLKGMADTLMRQLLAKEILYQPMKDIGERYPEWLEAHRSALLSHNSRTHTRRKLLSSDMSICRMVVNTQNKSCGLPYPFSGLCTYSCMVHADFPLTHFGGACTVFAEPAASLPCAGPS